MASTWTCTDGHTHETNRATAPLDPFSADHQGIECITCGDRIVGVTYPSGATATVVLREWTASTRVTAAAS